MIFDFEKVAGGFREVGRQNRWPLAPNEKAGGGGFMVSWQNEIQNTKHQVQK